MASLPASRPPPLAFNPVPRGRRRVPVFLALQCECRRCGRPIEDPLTVERWEMHCSATCFHARDLPPLFRQGA